MHRFDLEVRDRDYAYAYYVMLFDRGEEGEE